MGHVDQVYVCQPPSASRPAPHSRQSPKPDQHRRQPAIQLKSSPSSICVMYKRTDEVYESSWFAFKSLGFIMDKDNPRTTLNTFVIEEQVDTESQNKETEDILQSTTSQDDSVIFNIPSTRQKKKKLMMTICLTKHFQF
uniref:Uncharacterized protein n=1 Tax=Schizaphis graminum TaxID=13262 RepID=A0A2S2PBH7_SCHGA